jgi:hypothetical protein
LLPLAAVAQDASADPLPEQGSELASGRYVSHAVGPSVEFKVDDGWVVGASPPGPIFALERRDQPGTVMTITRFDGEVFVDSCDSTSMTSVDVDVSWLAEILAGNPYLNAGPAVQVDVDGNPGLSLDVAVPAYTECALPFLLLWALPIGEGGEFVQVADQQSRFVIFDVEGDVVVVAIESFPGVPFGGLLDASMELIDSIRIEPGTYVPPSPSASPDAVPGQTPEIVPEPSPYLTP